MRKLTKIIAPALIAVTALGVAGTASAQSYRHDDQRTYWHDGQRTPARAESIRAQINELQRRVNRNDNRDRISEREARGLRNDIGRLQMQFRTYNRDGLNNREMRYLQDRIASIRARLHIEARDWDNRRW